MQHARRVDVRRAGFRKGGPAADEHVVVHHRNLDRIGERALLRGGQLGNQIRDDAVVAGEHHVGRAHAVDLAVANVRNPHGTHSLGRSFLLHPDDSAAQADAGGGGCLVELRIVHRCRQNRLHPELAGHGCRHESVHEQAREGGVPVREVERVGVFPEPFLELQPQSVEPCRPAARGLEGGRRIDALVVASPLPAEKQNGVGVNLRVLEQKVLPADLRQRGDLLFRAHAGHVVRIVSVDANEIVADRVRERRVAEELRPCSRRRSLRGRAPSAASSRRTDDQAVFAEMLLVEEHRRAKIERLERLARLELAIALDLDA